MKKLSSVFILIFILVLSFTADIYAHEETDNGNIYEETENGTIVYIKENGTVTIKSVINYDSELEIPETIKGLPVKHIASEAFNGLQYIKKVIVPSSVESIGEKAFAGCIYLSEVILNNGTEKIGDSAFSGCVKLKKVSLPDTLVSIGDSAFYGCESIGRLKIPDGLSHIGVDAFVGCNKLLFDIDDNKTASEYAEKYSIPTKFTSTWTYTVLKLTVATVLIAAVIFVVYKIILKRKKTGKA